jgi:hypothetical protein
MTRGHFIWKLKFAIRRLWSKKIYEVAYAEQKKENLGLFQSNTKQWA